MSGDGAAGRRLTVVSVLPDLLGTYGDTGNVVVLRERLRRRGVPVQVLVQRAGDALPDADLYVIGGGEDGAQRAALAELRRGALGERVADGAHVFAVCAGLQLLGHTYRDGADRTCRGLGLLDVESYRLAHRAVGEVLADGVVPGGPAVVSGFANHRGGTRLGAGVQPLGRVRVGHGNEQDGGPEGAVAGRIVATYLHGPVLARNPALADWLLTRVTGEPLAALPADPADDLHAFYVRRRARARWYRRWRALAR